MLKLLLSEVVNDQINKLNISVTKGGNPFFLPMSLIKVLHGEDKHMRLTQTNTFTHTHTHLNTQNKHPTQENSLDGALLIPQNDEKLLKTMMKQ